MPVTWGTILLKYVLPVALFLGLLVYVGSAIHENGRQVERAVWQKEALAEASVHEAELESAFALASALKEQHQKQLQEVYRAKQKAIDNLERDVADLSTRGLYVPASTCPDVGVREARNNRRPGSPAGGVRLPEVTERNLIRLAELAQKTVIQYEGCRAKLMGQSVVVPLPP